MKSRTRIALAVLVPLLAVGCVTTSKYKKLQAETTELQSEQAKLQAQATQLTQENTALKASVDQMEAQQKALMAERDSLAQKNTETVSKYDAVVGQLSQEVNAGQLQITQYKNMLSVDVAERFFFASGSAAIKPSGKDLLKKVGDALNQYPDKIIRVVGHTDTIPLSKSAHATFPTNWELSVSRATNVVRFLQDVCKVAPERLIASGRSQYDPVAPNNTPEGRQKNRRIEITLIDRSALEAMKPPPADSTAAH